MKKIITIIFLITIAFCKNNLKAQSYSGCVILDNNGIITSYNVYANPTGGTVPNTTGSCNPNDNVSGSSTIPRYAGAITGSAAGSRCYTTTYNPTYTYRNCYVNVDGGVCGIVMTLNIVTCPIDNYSFILVLLAGVLGAMLIYKKNFLVIKLAH